MIGFAALATAGLAITALFVPQPGAVVVGVVIWIGVVLTTAAILPAWNEDPRRKRIAVAAMCGEAAIAIRVLG
jgi:hypothetical protein